MKLCCLILAMCFGCSPVIVSGFLHRELLDDHSAFPLEFNTSILSSNTIQLSFPANCLSFFKTFILQLAQALSFISEVIDETESQIEADINTSTENETTQVASEPQSVDIEARPVTLFESISNRTNDQNRSNRSKDSSVASNETLSAEVLLVVVVGEVSSQSAKTTKATDDIETTSSPSSNKTEFSMQETRMTGSMDSSVTLEGLYDNYTANITSINSEIQIGVEVMGLDARLESQETPNTFDRTREHSNNHIVDENMTDEYHHVNITGFPVFPTVESEANGATNNLSTGMISEGKYTDILTAVPEQNHGAASSPNNRTLQLEEDLKSNSHRNSPASQTSMMTFTDGVSSMGTNNASLPAETLHASNVTDTTEHTCIGHDNDSAAFVFIRNHTDYKNNTTTSSDNPDTIQIGPNITTIYKTISTASTEQPRVVDQTKDAEATVYNKTNIQESTQNSENTTGLATLIDIKATDHVEANRSTNEVIQTTSDYMSSGASPYSDVHDRRDTSTTHPATLTSSNHAHLNSSDIGTGDLTSTKNFTLYSIDLMTSSHETHISPIPDHHVAGMATTNVPQSLRHYSTSVNHTYPPITPTNHQADVNLTDKVIKIAEGSGQLFLDFENTCDQKTHMITDKSKQANTVITSDISNDTVETHLTTSDNVEKLTNIPSTNERTELRMATIKLTSSKTTTHSSESDEASKE